ncbi:hypothetical protein ACWD4P_33065, partial [Kitasatospora sp. NPDC002543]
IVVNDNERSYSPTIGGLANHPPDRRSLAGGRERVRTPRRVIDRCPNVSTDGRTAPARELCTMTT